LSTLAATFEAQYAAVRRERRVVALAGGALFAAAIAVSAWVGEFDPIKLVQGLPRVGEYIAKTLPKLTLANLGSDLAEWMWGLPKWLGLLWETVLMAYLGTLLGTLGALALAFHAADNLKRGPVSYFVVRRVFEIFRTVPDLVYALVFVFAFGIGPLAGILAIAVHSMGASGKLFAEAVENVDPRPIDGLTAAGASWLQTIRYAVLPAVLPNFLSFTLWRFEINVRSASVIGFVGAGGIGQEFYTAVRMLYYEDISAIILLVVATVVLIDMLCERLRHAAIGKEQFA
jgi:phosphonate transport system permease protein